MAGPTTEKLIEKQSQINLLMAEIADLGHRMGRQNLKVAQSVWDEYFAFHTVVLAAHKRMVEEQARWARAFGINVP